MKEKGINDTRETTYLFTIFDYHILRK